MTTSLSDAGLQFADGSVQSNAQVGFKNRIINGGFILNQRGYVSGTALAAGAYGHDRFKGGASGGTYTFTQGALGVNTTVTITAGTLVQVIEGCNVAEGGTYVLSWTGTAQARLNNGAYGASGTVTVTGWVAGTNLPVEFGTGTCGNIQLEKGSTATSFDYRPYGTELQLYQRYFLIYKAADWSDAYCRFTNGGMADNTGSCNAAFVLPITMRTVPTLYASAASSFSCYNGSFVNGLTSVVINSSNSSSVNLGFLKAASFTNGAFYQPLANTNNTAYLGFNSEF